MMHRQTKRYNKMAIQKQEKLSTGLPHSDTDKILFIFPVFSLYS